MPARTPKPAATVRSAAGATRNGTHDADPPEPVITMDAGGIIHSASDAVESVFGWSPRELIGLDVRELVPESIRPSLGRYLNSTRLTDQTKALSRTRRFNALRRDGEKLQIEMSLSHTAISSRPVIAAPFYVGLIRRVHPRKGVGADTATERSRLHRLIVEQTRALAAANLRLHLSDRSATLGTLAAGLGHDISNVLLPVRARLDAIEHAKIAPATRAHVTSVRRSIAYLQHLSDGLQFLAVDPDGGPGEPSDGAGSTDLPSWWRQVGSVLRKALPPHVALRASFPARLPAIGIAPHWLSQAMLNLIVNAGEAMPRGRRRATVRLWATASADGRAIRLGVTDNGSGMTHAIQRRAFDLYFTTKSRSMGGGLGLPLARKIVVRAGGSLDLKSEPGKGTTVVLVLPAVVGAASRAAAPAFERRSATVSVRDPRTAALISQVLLKAGLTLSPSHGPGPGGSDLWVTDPTPEALTLALPWRKRRAKRAIVLLGAPTRGARRGWAALGPTIIDRVDDFKTIRNTIGNALVTT